MQGKEREEATATTADEIAHLAGLECTAYLALEVELSKVCRCLRILRQDLNTGWGS